MTRIDETAYGPTKKMLVQHDTGWKVWGTCPSSLSDAGRGDKVSFSAVLQPSDNDPKFGFFSRPTKGVVLSKAESITASVQIPVKEHGRQGLIPLVEPSLLASLQIAGRRTCPSGLGNRPDDGRNVGHGTRRPGLRPAHPPSQIRRRKEGPLSLVTQTRPNRPDPHDVSGWSKVCERQWAGKDVPDDESRTAALSAREMQAPKSRGGVNRIFRKSPAWVPTLR